MRATMRDPATLTPPVLPNRPHRAARPLLAGGLNRRDMYLLALPVAILSLLPSWLERPLDAFEHYALPALLLLATFAALLADRWALERVLTGLLGGLWVGLLGRVAFVLLGSEDVALGALALCGPWIPVLLAAHVWMLGREAGRLASQLALGGLVLVVLVCGVLHPALATTTMGTVVMQVLLASLAALGGQRSGLLRLRREVRQQRLGSDLTGRGDSLTGLPDGRAARRWLRQATPRRLEGLAVAVIIIDHYPQIEATRGEAFAGCLLAHIARALEGALRDEDALTRLGPSEFAALLRVPDERAARAACERLRLRVASRPLDGVNVTVSVGVAVYGGEGDGLALLAGAQDALDDVRDAGGNRARLAGARRTIVEGMEPELRST
ncbi:GGDEF domain-containing protein [Deinococcus sp. KSM4-11]|uniref:GGDEF domain-containing protein n=1 Tax=Deinococcus sp. KSM4-11 TaxID=2568654 RepID=UPI0010A33B17|nr:GGDEF domain-containing protein [Deinococcus sp. KSM4-11]THF86778.1 GGDEF domain-containing protein [Deinococcus sp. KSM4-11]